MRYFIEASQTVALLLLDALSTALLVRVLLSWTDMENAFTEVLYRITEPFIIPFRILFYKMNWFQQSPLDMSFLFTVITISLLDGLIRAL